VSADRNHAAWLSLQNLQDPFGMYARTFRAKVVAQSDDSETVDLRPDDPALPDMAKINLRHGIPGLRIWVALGSYLLVGWDDGRPDRPFAALWNRDTHVLKMSLVNDELHLGGRDAVEALVHGTSYRQSEDDLFSGLLSGLSALATASQGPYMPLLPGFTTCVKSLTQFIAAAAAARGFLSPSVTTK
jgi:hypothetical protein